MHRVVNSGTHLQKAMTTFPQLKAVNMVRPILWTPKTAAHSHRMIQLGLGDVIEKEKWASPPPKVLFGEGAKRRDAHGKNTEV